MITAFARLNGFSVGIFANDPNFYAGSMTADNAKKTTRFIQNCNNFNIPILTFVDEPGFLIGPEAEKNAEYFMELRQFLRPQRQLFLGQLL